MDIKDSDNDSIDSKDEFEILKIKINIKDGKYLLKIFPSEEEDAIIFKLEKEKILTYYYVEIFDLRDFRQKNKLFISDDNINELYSHLKEINRNCSIDLEIKINKINILFRSNNDSKFILTFLLKKIMVPQKQLNPLLFRQAQENRTKLKMLKKQISKLNKAIQIKTDIINDFNNNIDNINSIIDNINNVNLNSNTNINKKKEKEEKKISNYYKEVKAPKENSSKQEIETIEKRYISNSRKRKNRKQNKKIKFSQMNNNLNNNNNTSDITNIFCFENIEILGNKKVFEFLVLFNIITIVVILCLLGSIYSIKSDLEYEKLIEDDFLNKLAYLNIGNEYYDEDDEEQEYTARIIKKNLETIDLKKYNFSLFENDKQISFFKEEIFKTIDDIRIKDIDFILKYKSKSEPKSFDKFYNNCKNIKDNLILMKNNKGKKLAIFSKNIYEILHGTISKENIENQKDFFIYSFNINALYQYSFRKNIFEIYAAFMHCISKWLSEEEASALKKFEPYNKNKYGKNMFKNIDEVEIYQIKYIR